MKLGNPTISWEICFARWFALQGGVPMQCMQSNVWLRLCRDRPSGQVPILYFASLCSHCLYVFMPRGHAGPCMALLLAADSILAAHWRKCMGNSVRACYLDFCPGLDTSTGSR